MLWLLLIALVVQAGLMHQHPEWAIWDWGIERSDGQVRVDARLQGVAIIVLFGIIIAVDKIRDHIDKRFDRIERKLDR